MSAQGLTVVDGVEERTIPFGNIAAIHAGVALVDGRRVLFVDLVMRRQALLALRLSSDDPGVPALFPQGTGAPQAWRAFIDKLLMVSNARKLHGESLTQFESPEAVTGAWVQALSSG